PVEIDGHLRWDADEIFKQLTEGAREAAARARSLGRIVQSIAVDSWGVDYGLLNSKGEVVEPPICYRDKRTAGTMEAVFQLIDRGEIFSRTGIQFLSFNTLFQLFAHKPERLDAGPVTLLLIPDLMNFFLTGKMSVEYTNATTTQLVNAVSRSWDREIIDAV